MGRGVSVPSRTLVEGGPPTVPRSPHADATSDRGARRGDSAGTDHSSDDDRQSPCMRGPSDPAAVATSLSTSVLSAAVNATEASISAYVDQSVSTSAYTDASPS